MIYNHIGLLFLDFPTDIFMVSSLIHYRFQYLPSGRVGYVVLHTYIVYAIFVVSISSFHRCGAFV